MAPASETWDMLNGDMQKSALPDVPWRGPILSRKHVVFVFGPPVHQTNVLCKRLAENFDGMYVTAASLMERELKARSNLAAEVKRAKAEAGGKPALLHS